MIALALAAAAAGLWLGFGEGFLQGFGTSVEGSINSDNNQPGGGGTDWGGPRSPMQ